MREDIISVDNSVQSDNTEIISEIIEDEYIDVKNEDNDFIEDFDTNHKKGVHGVVKLVLILIVACIVGFMCSGIFMSFANWIIFN